MPRTPDEPDDAETVWSAPQSVPVTEHPALEPLPGVLASIRGTRADPTHVATVVRSAPGRRTFSVSAGCQVHLDIHPGALVVRHRVRESVRLFGDVQCRMQDGFLCVCTPEVWVVCGAVEGPELEAFVTALRGQVDASFDVPTEWGPRFTIQTPAWLNETRFRMRDALDQWARSAFMPFLLSMWAVVPAGIAAVQIGRAPLWGAGLLLLLDVLLFALTAVPAVARVLSRNNPNNGVPYARSTLVVGTETLGIRWPQRALDLPWQACTVKRSGEGVVVRADSVVYTVLPGHAAGGEEALYREMRVAQAGAS